MTDQFEPTPGQPYGKCNDCGAVIDSQADGRKHMSETFEQAKAEGRSKGHSISVLNPSREGRIQNAVDRIVQDAIDDALEDLEDLDLDDDEIGEALVWHSSFRDAWDAKS
ncbi:hypothetical protein [Citricoccus sp. K5]|uniref:hypothetical protein n=1 Tax=Citricoccus sp. K5 TaxID=2653135 RepID=UPI0012F2CB84|nr:hypothetical protein [Citricoccus sp. K5]VXB23595.1 conserved hypothetical protein [Citricoccus sp. K5]